MKKTRCVQCGAFMGINIGLGHFNNGGEHRKTKDNQWACSDRCARDYNMALSLGGGGSKQNQQIKQKEIDPEVIAAAKAEEAYAKAERARLEVEQSKIDAQERIERAKIDLEKDKLKAQKAEKLRSEGKNIQAFMLIHPVWTGLIGLVSLFLVLLLVSGIKQFAASNKESNSLTKSQDLEKIESQIIIGITSKEPKEKLLGLVNSLQHDDNENYITGKKYNLIKNIYTHDPNFEFNGTYADYWGKLREAYKEIITSGLTIDEYKANLYKDNEATKIESNSVTPTVISDTTTKQITNDNQTAPVAIDTTTEINSSNKLTGFGLANKDKVFFYAEADNSTIRKAYITKGEKVNINNKVGDFYEVTYTSNAGNETKGYMLTSDIDLQN